MRSAKEAHRIIAEVDRRLGELLEAEQGPEPHQLRQITDKLFDATGLLMMAAGDIESGLVD